MSQFIDQYFDLQFMGNHFHQVFEAFVTLTLELWLVSGILSLIWGLVLSLLRQLPGRAGAPVRFLTIVYIDAFRGIPLLLVILLIYGGFGALSSGNATPGPIPEFARRPPLARQAGRLLVRGDGDHAHLRRLHGRGLPGRDRGGTQAVRPRRRARSG